MRRSFFLALVALLAPSAIPGGAVAQPAPGALPLDRLLPQIRRAYPGRFLDAQGITTNGVPHYHLKWLLPDGRIMWLDADARTGRVMQEAPGRDTFDGPALPAAPRNGANAARGARPQGNYASIPQQYQQPARPYDSRQGGPTPGGGNGAAGQGSGATGNRGYAAPGRGRGGQR